MSEKTQTITLADGNISLSTGKMAKLSKGAVLLQKGGTVLLATADVDTRDTELDYFPLGVEYIERMYAGGTISGSRFLKREGYPSEDAIIKARQVDHTIRPLFPKGFKKAVSVVLTVLAYDGVNDPEAMTVLGASCALMISGIPFHGPAASVMIGVDENSQLVINPASDKQEDLKGLFAVSGNEGKVLNIEGVGKEISEETMDEILDLALGRITELCNAQKEYAQGIARPAIAYSESSVDETLVEKILATYAGEMETALYDADKEKRDANVAVLQSKVVEALATEGSGIEVGKVKEAFDYASKKIMRKNILNSDRRFSGRKLDEIRELSAETDILPTVHGSALFSRGITQSLSIVTLGSTRMVQHLDGMEGEETKRFMHHYNMPSYTTGEAGRYNYRPGRREIGHGTIGENALKNMIPSEDEFPYTIRVVSEIMTSNGSTSMAATCASSMALMAAGVPMKAPVAGIGVGLVTADDDQKNYKLLLDIEGVEDFFGDMDFKVTGTNEGITAIQFETKLKGVEPSILKEAFRLSKSGRAQVLSVMNTVINTSRTELAPTAPRVEVIKINPEKIGELIGPGGKNIKAIIEEGNNMGSGNLEIDINDDGRVTITAVDQAQRDFAVAKIKGATQEPEIGKIYDGVIDKVVEFGAFVNIAPGLTGLIHVSEMSDSFVKDPNEVVKSGDRVKVKLIKMERGKQSYSMKGIPQGATE